MNNKSIGRPRRDDLTSTIKFATDSKTSNDIRSLAKERNISQSELMREMTNIITSKTYESLLPVLKIEQLQKISEKCWDDLHTSSALFSTEKISENMPAFVTTWNPPQVHVKYPTFKIEIFNKQNNNSMTDPPTIDRLLKNVKYRSDVYYTPADYLIKNGQITKLDFRFISEVTCLSTDLNINQQTQKAIQEILKNNGYDFSVYPGYCLRSANIELINDGTYFKIIPDFSD